MILFSGVWILERRFPEFLVVLGWRQSNFTLSIQLTPTKRHSYLVINCSIIARMCLRKKKRNNWYYIHCGLYVFFLGIISNNIKSKFTRYSPDIYTIAIIFYQNKVKKSFINTNKIYFLLKLFTDLEFYNFGRFN